MCGSRTGSMWISNGRERERGEREMCGSRTGERERERERDVWISNGRERERERERCVDLEREACGSRTGSMPRDIKKRALLVGCNYPGTGRELTGCWNDVQSMRETLINRFGFNPQDICVLVDEPQQSLQPTGEVVKRYLEKLVRDLQAGDVLVFFFSGHGIQLPPEGVPDETGGHECIMLADTNVITDMDFRVLVENLPDGVQFTVIADSCHSGVRIEHLEEQIGSGSWFHTWLNKEHQQVGPGPCGYSGVHCQDYSGSHFAYAEGSSGNDHVGTYSQPQLSVLEKIGCFPDFPCTTDGHLKQEIFTMGRKGNFEGVDSIEFIFKQVEDMSKVVGVGLQWSKVVVTKQFGVVIKHIGENSWFDLWKETSFSPMRILIPKPPSKLSMCNLTPEQSSKSFGVGLVGSRLENNRMYVEDNQNQIGEMFSFIFELAEKMGLSKNARDSNFQHRSGISSEVVEGEKNNHGPPLLETMQGEGETDEGGTSSEPMDPMEVGESSQGGNSGELMEGVESGQGGPSSGPMEVGGQRDQQSSPFQLRFESLQAKGPQDSNENKSLNVIVIPEVGGIFYEGLSNQQVQPDCRIKGATIAPWLKFKFEILGGERKITTTTETRCDLGGGQLTLHEDWDLGYCHDNITISLMCENRQAVQVSRGTVVAVDVMKRAMTETFTGSMSRANQIASQANLQVQMPVVPIGIQAQGTLEVTDTIADSHALAITVETSNTQFSGFNVNQLECAGSLVFNFLYPEEIIDVKARGKRQFIHAGINKTLWPTIVGKWFPLDREEARLYIFKTDRDIHSIGSLMRLHANMKKPMFMEQKYEVPFVINHAMSHIHYYEDKELKGPGVKSVDGVLTKYPEV